MQAKLSCNLIVGDTCYIACVSSNSERIDLFFSEGTKKESEEKSHQSKKIL